MRKAQYQFGWDWGPRLVTAGIWKDVKIEFWNTARIETIKVEQKKLSGKSADLYIHTSILAEKEGKYTFRINDKANTVQLKKETTGWLFLLPFGIRNCGSLTDGGSISL